MVETLQTEAVLPARADPGKRSSLGNIITIAKREVSGYFAGLGATWIREHPGDAARLFVRKLWLVAHRTELPLNYSYAYYERDERTVLRWLPIGSGSPSFGIGSSRSSVDASRCTAGTVT